MTKELTTIQKSLSPIVDQALSIIIKKPADMVIATEILSKLNSFNDRIAEEREKVTKPLMEALKAERARWKPAESANEEAINYVRKEMTRYQTEQIAIQKAKEQAIAAKVSKGEIELDKAVAKIEKIKAPADNIATTAGDVQFVEVKKFEVVDISKLPIEYHLSDEVKIRAKLKQGVELPGVRYWTEQVPRNYR